MHTIDDLVREWRRCLESFNCIQFPAAPNGTPPPSTLALQHAFEVERSRLMLWGIAVGLKDASPSQGPSQQQASRVIPLAGFLRNEPLRKFTGEGMQLILIMLISDSARKKHGLETAGGGASATSKEEKRKSSLRGLFKRSWSFKSESSAVESSSSSTGLGPAPVWMVSKEDKFRMLVAQTKQVIDTFDDLLAKTGEGDARIRGVRADSSSNIEELRDVWSSSINVLGLGGGTTDTGRPAVVASTGGPVPTAVPASTGGPAPTPTPAAGRGPSSTATVAPQPSTGNPGPSSISNTQAGDTPKDPPDDLDEYISNDLADELAKMTESDVQALVYQERMVQAAAEERPKRLEQFVYEQLSRELKGALNISLSAPTEYSATAQGWVEIEGHTKAQHAILLAKDVGTARTIHPAFDLYHRKKYIPKKIESSLSDEDQILLDAEADPQYEHVNPGTVTVHGFGLEVWNYEEKHGRPRSTTTMFSTAQLPEVGTSQLLRRIDELQKGSDPFGRDPQLDADNMREFFGTMG